MRRALVQWTLPVSMVALSLACGSASHVEGTADAASSADGGDGARPARDGAIADARASDAHVADGSAKDAGGKDADARDGASGDASDGGSGGDDRDGAARDGGSGSDARDGRGEQGGDGSSVTGDSGRAGDAVSDARSDHSSSHAGDGGALLAAACGDTGGLQAGAPWPMQGRCPTRMARGDAIGPSRSNGGGWGQIFSGAQAFDYGTVTSPVVDANGTVYVGIEGVGTVASGVVAISSIGDLLWNHATTASVLTAPLVRADGSILAGSSDGTVFVLDAASGNLRWSTSVSDSYLSAPLVTADGTIYIGNANKASGGNGLVALDRNGTLLWRVYESASAYPCDLGSGGASLRQDGTLWMNCGDHLASVSAAGVMGTTADSFITDFLIGGAPTIGADGSLWFGGFLEPDGATQEVAVFRYPLTGAYDHFNFLGSVAYAFVYGVALLPNGDAVFGAPGGSSGDDLYEQSATTPNPTLSIGPYAGEVSTQPTIDAAGNVYFAVGSTFQAISATGASLWSSGVGSTEGSGFAGSALGADGTLYVSVGNGIFAFAP